MKKPSLVRVVLWGVILSAVVPLSWPRWIVAVAAMLAMTATFDGD